MEPIDNLPNFEEKFLLSESGLYADLFGGESRDVFLFTLSVSNPNDDDDIETQLKLRYLFGFIGYSRWNPTHSSQTSAIMFAIPE